MHVELEDFKTGWYGITIGIKTEEINMLIERLALLRKNPDQHFHLASNCKGKRGIADIEFYLEEKEKDNMFITGTAITPTR